LLAFSFYANAFVLFTNYVSDEWHDLNFTTKRQNKEK